MAQPDPDHAVPRTSLPATAQRWLERALPPESDLSDSILLEQEGSMELRGRWTPFKATGLYQAPPLSFTWQAKFNLLPGVWIVAEDGHLGGMGWGGSRLWGIIPMGKKTDPEVLATQVVRNLAELAWLPAFALMDPDLQWADAGEAAFEVRSQAGSFEATVRFEVDDHGDLVRASSPARPYDVPGGYAQAPWKYEFGNHQTFEGMRIPGTAVATFFKSDGPWEYLRCRVTAVNWKA